jgi:tRNA(adenine34) deaminase
MNKDEFFMEMALNEAKLAEENHEVPVGAVVVCNDRVIAKAYNQTEMLNDITAHA